MDTLWQDVRYAVRVLAKNPGFTAVVVVALALGIGANSALFSVVNTVLLSPLPFSESDRLMSVAVRNVNEPEGSPNVAYLDFLDYRERNRSFADLAAYSEMNFSMTAGDEPERLHGVVVSDSLFPTLRVGPLLGRALAPEDGVKGASPVVVIGYGLWQRRFGGDPNVVGRTVLVESRPTTIVGVMPDGFQFPVTTDPIDVWGPVAPDSFFAQSRGAHFLRMVGRLGDGVTQAQATADMTAIAESLEQQYPDSNTDYRPSLRPLQDELVGDIRSALLILFAAVGFVLLIACANVANLLLARSLSRQTELSIRAALGASRWRLGRQVLTESLLLALVGGALGLLVATWGAALLASAIADQIPRASEVGLDGRVLGFTFAVSVLTGVLFGLAPTLRLARTDPNEALKEGGRGMGEGVRHNRVRSLLVVSEVAISVVLLVGAGLLIRSFVGLIRVDAGFDPTNVVTMQLNIPAATYGDDASRAAAIYDGIVERTSALPGVKAAAAATTIPLSGSSIRMGYVIPGLTPENSNEQPSAPFDAVTKGYFRAMGIPVLSGREFTAEDTKESQPVIVVSESFARRYWPNGDAVGQRIRPDYSADDEQPPDREVVGVVGDLKHEGLDAEATAAIYAPYSQTPLPFGSLVVVSESNPSSVAAGVRKEMLAIDRNLPVSDVRLMDRVVSDSVAQPRLYMALLTVFAAVALALTAVGIYGVIATSVRRRTHEIGIRMALGATTRNVLGLVIVQGMSLVLVGVAAGVAGAFAATRLMESMLFGVSSSDLLTFVGVGVLLAAVALLAIYIPARRAARLDPMDALRCE